MPSDLLAAGKLDELEQVQAKSDEITPEVAYARAWGLILEGNELRAQAENAPADETGPPFERAVAKYEAALAIKPDMHEALNSWGNALTGWAAKMKSGDEADRLFALAGEKYEAALAIKPNKPEALLNWGSALGELARTKSGDEADRLFTLAGEKYEAALRLKPDMHEALFGVGHGARRVGGDEVGRRG